MSQLMATERDGSLDTYVHYGGTPPHSDEDTSLEAAWRIRHSVDSLQTKILDFIQARADGATCDEVEELLKMRHQTAGPRIRELVLDGLLEDRGKRRKTRSGSNAIAWEAVKHA